MGSFDGVKSLTCYRIHERAPRIVPGRAARAWMDATDVRYAYRCLPLTIANAMGWEILTPCRIAAEWNGGNELGDLTVASDDPDWPAGKIASSHFGHGILTFHIGYLFRTEPGVALWARGAPNWPKDGIAPLDGVIETDWLTFTFTMNWQFTRPGRVTFEKDEPFCFLLPIGYRALDDLVPQVVPLADEPELAAQFKAYGDARAAFNAKLAVDDPETVEQGWQKWYMRGEAPTGDAGSPLHLSKLRLAAPVEAKVPSAPSGPKEGGEPTRG
jgi:hypothetical protein